MACSPHHLKRLKNLESVCPPFVTGQRMVKYRSSSHQVDTDGMIPVLYNNNHYSPLIEHVTSHSKDRKKNQRGIKRERQEHSTAECLLRSKKMTFTDKSKPSKNSTLGTKSSVTSVVDSITNGKDSRGFWSKSKQEQSKRLWWPTKIDWQDSERNSSSGSSDKRAHLSSFSIKHYSHPQKKSLKTSWLSSTFSLAGSTEKEDTTRLSQPEKNKRSKMYKNLDPTQKKEMKKTLDQERVCSTNRMRKIELKPTSAQHHYLMVWFKDARWTYNRGIQRVIEEKWHLPTCTVPLNTIESILNKRFVGKSGLVGRELLRTRTPKVIRQQAIKSISTVLKAYRTNVQKRTFLRSMYPTNKKFHGPLAFQPSFKSAKHMTHDTIHIERVSLKFVDPSTCSIYRLWKPKNLPDGPKGHGHKKEYMFRNLQTTSGLLSPELMQHDFGIHTSFGKLYLLLTYKKTVGTIPRNNDTNTVVAIDPGVRRFATTYAPEGDVVIYGDNTTKVVDKLIRRIDRCKDRLSYCLDNKDKKRFRFKVWDARNKYHEAERKAKCVIRNLHYNVAHSLLKHNDIVIYPTVTSHHWRQGTGLPKSVKRRSQMLSFGQFRRRLIETSSAYANTKILTGSEAYTSKQCGACGTLNDKLGSSIVFKCSSCKQEADRDVHGARNILLRFLTKID
jgi:transposase